MKKLFILYILSIFTGLILSFSSRFFDLANKNNYMANINLKKELLNVEDKKLILVGGSSFGFSINSTVLEYDLDYDVINYGLHAGLGAKYMLDQIFNYTNDGDIVVLGFEYPLYYGEKDNSLILLSNNIQNIYKNILIEKYIYRLNILLKSLYPYIRNGVFPQDLVYRSDAIDFNGDIISHLDLPNKSIDFENKIVISSDLIFDEIFKFIKFQEKKGVRVYITFPPIPKSYYAYNFLFIDEISNKVYDFFPKHVISSHKDYVFDDNFFYDTVYHMNNEGRNIRANILKQDLERKLNGS
jgi:hypothetical protein